MKDEEIVAIGLDAISLWERKVNDLLKIYLKLEEDVKKAGKPIDRASLLQEARILLNNRGTQNA